MDDTKQKESVYSNERTKTAALAREPEETQLEEAPAPAPAAESSKPTQEKSQEHPAPAFSPISGAGEASALVEFAEFVKRTRNVWLVVAGFIFGLMAMVTLVERVSEWARKTRVTRQDRAVASVTPESLLTRCGAPVDDATKDMYPILMRTMRYKSGTNEVLVFSFSRTAEDKSDWVFLSMKNESGTMSYETPEQKIAAMSCLDSRKK